jgi:glutathione synthase/RimK-type ligase-like ATP-grasp enzyme
LLFHKTAKASKFTKIVKSLSGEQVDLGKVFYSTRVNPSQLDPKYSWFIQDYVQAIKDITVVFCRGKLFAFELKRSFLKRSSDWREFIPEGQKWISCKLPVKLCNRIKSYMKHLQFDYGRLDFLLTPKNEFVFCEVNPNGQYAWLDLEGKHGLLDCIASEISPITPVHPIPHLNPVRCN